MTITRRSFLLGSVGAALVAFGSRSFPARAFDDALQLQGTENDFRRYAPLQTPELELCDYHIHIRGKMTPELARKRTLATGVRPAFSKTSEGNGPSIRTNSSTRSS